MNKKVWICKHKQLKNWNSNDEIAAMKWKWNEDAVQWRCKMKCMEVVLPSQDWIQPPIALRPGFAFRLLGKKALCSLDKGGLDQLLSIHRIWKYYIKICVCFLIWRLLIFTIDLHHLQTIKSCLSSTIGMDSNNNVNSSQPITYSSTGMKESGTLLFL